MTTPAWQRLELAQASAVGVLLDLALWFAEHRPDLDLARTARSAASGLDEACHRYALERGLSEDPFDPSA
jgi:hypothetical protein